MLTGVASAVELPGGLSSILAFDPGTVLGMLFASFFCMFMGSAVASVITPVYFRFGQTKTAQYLPMMTVLIFIIPMLIIGSGVLDDAAVSMETLAELLKLIDARDYYLAIIGSRGLTGIKGYVGSVSYKVLQNANIPVLITK